MPTRPTTAAIVTDGAAGNEKQACALAHYLGLETQVYRVELRALSAMLAPFLWRGRLHDMKFSPPVDARRLPPLLIGCGRAGGVAVALLKRAHPDRQALQILDPHGRPRDYDLIITPQHDRLRADNVMVSIGALHQVDGPFLARAKRDYDELGRLPAPRIAVLFGAPTRHAKIDDTYIDQLFAELPSDASLLITASRRTPARMIERLRAMAHARGRFWAGPADGANPYPGFLAHADALVVTPDSVNMLSEACATQAPVYVLPPVKISGKLERFLAALIASGRVQRLGALELKRQQVIPFRETEALAAEVARRLGWPASPAN